MAPVKEGAASGAVPWQGRLLADQKANKVLDAHNVEVSI
jgi:hypothetical protein